MNFKKVERRHLEPVARDVAEAEGLNCNNITCALIRF